MRKQEKENRRRIGAKYEKQAGAYLKEKGFCILQYNYRCPFGEIDIIAREGAYLVFCEVKYRKTGEKGSPMEAVTHKKQRIISKCALWYLTKERKISLPCRFDVIGIAGEDGKEDVTLLRNAFDCAL